MFDPLQFKIRHLPLDHAWIGARAPRWQPPGGNILEQAQIQQRQLLRHNQLKLWYRVAHDLQRMHKAEPIRIQIP